MSIVALFKTRLANEGQFPELSSAYVFFWSGIGEECKREYDVAFAVQTSIVSGLEELPSGFCDRIMTLKLPLLKCRFVTLVNVYAPIKNSGDEDKVAFYLSLRELVRKIPPADRIIILGDFNARGGRDYEGADLRIYGISF